MGKVRPLEVLGRDWLGRVIDRKGIPNPQQDSGRAWRENLVGQVAYSSVVRIRAFENPWPNTSGLPSVQGGIRPLKVKHLLGSNPQDEDVPALNS